MKRTLALLLCLGCSYGLPGEGSFPGRAEGVLDIDAPIVARVGGEFVTGAEIRRAFAADPFLQMLKSRREKAGREGKWDEADEEQHSRRVEKGKRAAALDVVVAHLLAKEALGRGIIPPDADIERRLQRTVKMIGDPQEHGYTIDELRAETRRKVLREKLERMERVGPTSLPSPARIRSFYQEHKDEILRPDCVKLRVIRIARTRRDPILGAVEIPEALRKAEELAARVSLSPHKFADYARDHSEDPETAERGGLVVYRAPWGRSDLVPRDVLPKWLREVVGRLEPGQTSPVAETPEGFYIVSLEAETPPEKLSFKDAQEMIMNILRRQDAVRARREWFRKRASQAVVTDGLGRRLDLESLLAQLEN